MAFQLADRTDLAKLADEYRREGAVSIESFLRDADAAKLAEYLERSDRWSEVFRAADQVYDMPVAEYEKLTSEQQQRIGELVGQSALAGLQYRYRSIRVPDEESARGDSGTLLDDFATFLSSPEVLALLRSVTGSDAISFVDAQATSYGAGSFLTTHDDAVEGKGRIAAYVFGLTKNWSADWGGLLLFDRKDRVTGFTPDFNVLRVFAVPRQHHVSYVAPYVPRRRLSVTGWLRDRRPD